MTNLPHLHDGLFVTDSGLETELVFNHGYDLPCFASFPLLDSAEGRTRLAAYYGHYLDEAAARGLGCLLETPTWRAGKAWGEALGCSDDDLRRINHEAVAFLRDLSSSRPEPASPVVVSGNIGPMGDGYDPETVPDAAQSQHVHALQLQALAEAGADMASAFTITHSAEAIGMVRAAQSLELPMVISFTLETDGRLPSGQALGDAIRQTDAETGSGPIYYMINCAHPDHFADLFAEPASWHARIGGIRANASRKSHAELDEATELDDGNPAEFGALYGDLMERLPNLRVIGGCCGTDHRHVGHALDRCHGDRPVAA